MIEKILNLLDKVQNKGKDRFMACCPAHDDSDPSLAITELQDGRILIHCFAGCQPIQVLNAIGLTMEDLFPDGGLGEFRGWEQLKREQEAKRQNKQLEAMSEEKLILAICDGMRKRGERLTPKDMERERLAYQRIKNATA